MPISVAILIGLFWVQRYGTAPDRRGVRLGDARCGSSRSAPPACRYIVRNPGVLAAVSPHYAIDVPRAPRRHGFLLLGSVVLCVTGGEALYADMGHFGAHADPARVVR